VFCDVICQELLFDPQKTLPLPRTAVVYIFHFPVVRVDFGLVSGDTGDSGLGISLFRLMQVPSKVPDRLTRTHQGGLFSGLGLIMGDLNG